MINNAVFGKAMEDVRKQRDIKLFTTERRRNYLVSEPNYHITKVLHRKFISYKNEKNKQAEIPMNKPVHLGLSILELSKILMYEFWYDYVKPKYGERVKLCYMNTDNFIASLKTEDSYKDIAEDVETRIDTANYELECNSIDTPLPKIKNKKSN